MKKCPSKPRLKSKRSTLIAPKISWQVLDSGTLPGHENMTIDKWALEEMDSGANQNPKIRFFQWDKPTVSFGTLMDQTKVREWALSLGRVDFVQRPTAGGAVLHQTTDLSLAVLWPRGKKIFPENPRKCYAEIHSRIKGALEKFNPNGKFSLYARTEKAGRGGGTEGDCAAAYSNTSPAASNFSICFDTPVCNDVMREGRKIVGGALRLTKKTILYQGNIILEGKADFNTLKKFLASSIPRKRESIRKPSVGKTGNDG